MKYTYAPSTHDKAAGELFGEQERVAAGGEVTPCLLIGFVNRSGSNYFAELLQSTGAFAGLRESLNDNAMRLACENNELRGSRAYLEHLRRTQIEQPGQMWGVKTNWVQVAMLMRWRAIPHMLAPKMVIVSRKDILGQAVSFYIAKHTKQWRSVDEAADVEVTYNFKQLMNTMRSVGRSYFILRQTAAMAQIPCREIVYEDLLAAPDSVIGDVTEWLVGRRLVPVQEQVGIAIQRNSRNAELKARFLEDLRTMKWETEKGMEPEAEG